MNRLLYNFQISRLYARKKMDTKKDIIGFWGYPEPSVFKEIISKNPDCIIIDLDIDYGYIDSAVIPDAYCRIIKNIINNAIYLKDRIKVIVASVGEEKCNSGLFAAVLLEDMGFNVVKTKFETYPDEKFSLPISQSNLPLREKIDLIMDGVYLEDRKELEKSSPAVGFWGVPPNDFRILDLFPDNTHIYGWLRCVEAKRPADIELEMYVDKNVPTVFFSQTFCGKMQLAKYLADKYNGLYIDIDESINRSAIAKVEAFINLR